MAKQTPCILIVTAQIDASVEDAWNEWYDEVHLPAALACPGVISGTRYVSTGDASKIDHGERSTEMTKIYTTVYEIESPQTLLTPEFKAMRGWYHFSEHIKARTQVLQLL